MAKKEAPCQCEKGERVLLVEGKNDCHVIRMYLVNAQQSRDWNA
jgi:5S rRNA maturation endonuclease (ribonuclease M5)